MHLSEVRVRNYRSLKDVTLHLHPGINALVGRNNVGKTNLLHAIRHALGGSAFQESLWLLHEDLFRTDGFSTPANTIRVDLSFENLSESQLAQFFEILDLDTTDISKSTARIHFEATWNDTKKRFAMRRWGGPEGGDVRTIPPELLDSLPVTFLPALRDAETALAPGPRSRLARVLETFAEHAGDNPSGKIEDIFREANSKLGKERLVEDVTTKIASGARAMAGSDFSKVAIQSSEPGFPQILRTLKMVVGGNPVPDLRNSGLGYNNLIYMATILAHLGDSPDDECPLLLIEEPEAHLHPQLVVLLGNYFKESLLPGRTPQAIISTHSPTLAAHLKPSQICSVHVPAGRDQAVFIHLGDAGLDPREERQLERMLDITKSTLFFSKGLILVEGISEALMVPRLAKALGLDLAQEHVSVLPICGVSFATFQKILKPEVLGIPTVILTDGDPALANPEVSWREQVPSKDPKTGAFTQSDRTTALLDLFRARPCVEVCPSEVTLEYDLAAASEENALVIATEWEKQFKTRPGTLDRAQIEGITGKETRALAVWRGICRADTTGSKAELAHFLAERLDSPPSGSAEFAVPPYIRKAVDFLKRQLGLAQSSTKEDETPKPRPQPLAEVR
jgi:putative ATP-dependent endonuclease of OLD family